LRSSLADRRRQVRFDQRPSFVGGITLVGSLAQRSPSRRYCGRVISVQAMVTPVTQRPNNNPCPNREQNYGCSNAGAPTEAHFIAVSFRVNLLPRSISSGTGHGFDLVPAAFVEPERHGFPPGRGGGPPYYSMVNFTIYPTRNRQYIRTSMPNGSVSSPRPVDRWIFDFVGPLVRRTIVTDSRFAPYINSPGRFSLWHWRRPLSETGNAEAGVDSWKRPHESGDLPVYRDRFEEAQCYASAGLKSMTKHEVSPTPHNFAIWYEHHAGQNPKLSATIDIIQSNHRSFDEKILNDLYADFLTTTKEEQALHGISDRVHETLHEVQKLVDSAHNDVTRYGLTLSQVSGHLVTEINPLAALLERLVREAREMAQRSRRLGLRLKNSALKIKTLEHALDDVRREATTDALTQIANRRHFDAKLREAAGDAMNSGDDLALLLGDIDHFKKFNDTWGHQTGDDVLRMVALTIQQNIRDQDIVARYGGEEFAVILPSTSLEEAASVGNNLRRALEKQQAIEGDTQQLCGGITMSFGTACYEPGEPLANWIRRADAALYRAKEKGRNCVVHQ
jgi:diguanylate cyclase